MNIDSIRPPDDIIVDALCALNGEITPSMRMVALRYRYDEAKFRFYMAEEPTDDERENAEIVAVNFESLISHKLRKLDLEFVVTSEPFGKLDTLDFVIFARSESV
tara:strand:+ start:674 stop:988 length:315 start_codon:yes stop_codon:yes gene_type:complete